eukprot:gene35572-biopygen97114
MRFISPYTEAGQGRGREAQPPDFGDDFNTTITFAPQLKSQRLLKLTTAGIAAGINKVTRRGLPGSGRCCDPACDRNCESDPDSPCCWAWGGGAGAEGGGIAGAGGRADDAGLRRCAAAPPLPRRRPPQAAGGGAAPNSRSATYRVSIGEVGPPDSEHEETPTKPYSPLTQPLGSTNHVCAARSCSAAAAGDPRGGGGDATAAGGTDKIKLLNWNADGITTGDAEKMEELIDYAESSKPTIIVITEGKLDDGVKDGTVAIPGYSLYRVDRDLGKSVAGLGGGILVYCKDGIELTDEVQFQGSDMEMFAANIPALKCRLVAVYRRPGYAISEESLAQLTKQVAKNGRTVVTGDLNMDTRMQNPAPQTLWLALQEAGLTQRVRFVTHPPNREGVKASTIDHVWAPRGVAVECKRVKGDLLDGASDHHAIEATFAARAAVQRRSKARRAYLRSRTAEDKELFKEAKQAARKAIRDAKAAMIHKDSEEAGKDAKARWKLRKALAGQARSVPPQPAATAEETNEFFIAKPRRVRQSTLYAPLATVHPTATETMCQFKPVSTGEVL